jgi:NitT/TauT family transport system substrate-binding protein
MAVTIRSKELLMKNPQSVLRNAVIALLLAAMFLGACAQQAAKPPLKIGWVVWAGEYPYSIAQEKGFFAKHGIEVELKLYDSTSPELMDLSAGSLDGTISTPFNALLVSSSQPELLQGIMVADSSEAADVVVASPDIRTPADLKGKRIGVQLGAYGEMFVRKMLDAYGLTNADVILVNIDPELSAVAIPDQVDAAHTYDPYTAEAVAQGNHILFTSAETPGLLPDVMFFRSQVVEDRPEDVRAFIAAWFEAVAYWQANPEECSQIIAQYTGLTPEEVTTEGVKIFTLADNEKAFQKVNDTTSIYFTTGVHRDFLIQSGVLTRSPDLETFLTPSFLK